MNTSFAESDNLYKSSLLEDEDNADNESAQEAGHEMTHSGKRSKVFNVYARRKIEEYFENKQLEFLTRDLLSDNQ
jgi:hypothetical protein